MSLEVSGKVASVTVRLIHHGNCSEEFGFTWEKAQEYASNGVAAAVLFPGNDAIINFCNEVLTHDGKNPWIAKYRCFQSGKRSYDYNNLNVHLKQQGLPLQVIGGGAGSMREADANSLVSVLTYHSAKGLDFEAVFLPDLTKDAIIWKDPDVARRMFFVALTRSRRDLYLSYHGEPHEFIRRIPSYAVQFHDATQVVSTQSSRHRKDYVVDVEIDF